MLNIVIADPQTVLRHGLRLILQEDAQLRVVGQAASGHEAITQAGRLPLISNNRACQFVFLTAAGNEMIVHHRERIENVAPADLVSAIRLAG